MYAMLNNVIIVIWHTWIWILLSWCNYANNNFPHVLSLSFGRRQHGRVYISNSTSHKYHVKICLYQRPKEIAEKKIEVSCSLYYIPPCMLTIIKYKVWCYHIYLLTAINFDNNANHTHCRWYLQQSLLVLRVQLA